MQGLVDFLTFFGPISPLKFWFFAALTAIFAGLGRAVRGVTTGGAIAGSAVCLALLLGAGIGGFFLLLTVFVLTWISTRLGWAHKIRLGTAEARAGRDALQVLANLAAAASCALVFAFIWPDQRLLIAMAAALAEAAADTVSSEIGQAFGANPRLVTNWGKVAAGTNGAITLAGTLAGVASGLTVALVGVVTGLFAWRVLPVCVVAGVMGMIADSFLGATLESRGLLGNNAVNFISTVVAAVIALNLQ